MLRARAVEIIRWRATSDIVHNMLYLNVDAATLPMESIFLLGNHDSLIAPIGLYRIRQQFRS